MLANKKEKICLIIEYFIAIYVLTTNIINVLNHLTNLTVARWIMRKTFWGPSLLVLLIVEYLLYSINCEKFLDKVRFGIVPGIIAGVMSVGSMPMNLLLAFIIGGILIDGRQNKNVIYYMLISAIGIEMYSVVLTIEAKTNGMPTVGSGLLYSIIPDAGLILSIIFVWLFTNGKSFLYKYCLKLKNIVWLMGTIVCIISIGFFVLYLITFNISQNKIVNNNDEIYLLENIDDNSYVLTAVKDKFNNQYKLEFTPYIGKNNQKIYFECDENGLYEIIFLNPKLALETQNMYENVSLELPQTDAIEQKWFLEEENEEQGIYRLRNTWNYSLSYANSIDGEIGEEVLLQKDENICQNFKIEKTLKNSFITQSVKRYYEQFQITTLWRTLWALFGRGIWVIYLMVAMIFCGIIYVKKVLGNLIALIICVTFTWLLVYSSVVIIIMLGAIVELILFDTWIKFRKCNK